MTMLKPSDCVEAQRSQVTCPWLKEKSGMELKLNDFQARGLFQCGCLDLDHKNTLLLSPNEGHAPQGDRRLKRRLVVSW